MKRKIARELAVLLIASLPPGEDTAAALDRFFSEEHYATLAGEDPVFEEFPDEKALAYIRAVTNTVAERRETLDGYIETYAKGWKAGRLSRPVRAILRCAVCEALYISDVPAAAAINEAVELAKKYGDTDETPAFVNGVLGGFMRGENIGGAGDE